MTILSLISLKLCAVGIVYLLIAALVVTRYGRRVPAVGADAAVSILRPLHGLEAGLYENLESCLVQRYAAPVQLVLGLQNPLDPALDVVERLRLAHPEADIAVVVDAAQHGSNRKVSNLVNMSGAIRHGTVILADSDMRFEPDFLSGIVGELGRAGVGIVSCPYHGLPQDDGPSRLAALGVEAAFLPSVIVGYVSGMAHPCMGSAIALRRETLDAIGGFRSVADALADDYELGRRVRATGLNLALTPFSVGHVFAHRAIGEVMSHELRWMRTTRQIAPAGHFGSFVTHPLPFGLIALALDPGFVALGFVAVAVAARYVLCLAVERAFGLAPRPHILLPVRDLLSFAVFLASLFGRRVSWRGFRYEVSQSGALLPQSKS